jgi:FtsZ-interacting cell division protein ZipA
MSDLQISLLILGAAVIVAVVAYNRIQEARFRRRAEGAFSPDRGDPLMDTGNSDYAASERIEPLLQGDSETQTLVHGGRQEPRANAPEVGLGEAVADPISYAAEIRSVEAVGQSVLQELRATLGTLTSRVRIERWDPAKGAWLSVGLADADAGTQLRLSLQLADRRGAVTSAEVVAFQSAVARCAASMSADATIPELEPFLVRARELDTFCAQVDVAVGINIIAPRGRPFSGTKLRGLVEAVGFRLGDGAAFNYPDGQGGTCFTLENQEQPPFSVDALRSLATNGVTLLLDVPRLPDGIAAFNEMVKVGRQLAGTLDGALVDDNGIAVSEPGLEQIRNQLRNIYASMQARGIAPGSELALRLFA